MCTGGTEPESSSENQRNMLSSLWRRGACGLEKYMQPKSWKLGFIGRNVWTRARSPDSLSPEGRQRADSEEQGRIPAIYKFCSKGQVVNIKGTVKLEELNFSHERFSNLLCMGRCKHLSLPGSFLLYTSVLGPILLSLLFIPNGHPLHIPLAPQLLGENSWWLCFTWA